MINLIYEIYYIFKFFWMIIQTIYLSSIDHEKLKKYDIKYNINNEQKSAVIYEKFDKKNVKNIYFLSGGFVLSYTVYIKKVVSDLLKFNFLINEYNLIIIEKKDQCNLSLYDDLCKIIGDTIFINTEEIIFIGFSGGGVVSSHVMHRLKHINCKKKLILYDSTFNVIDNIRQFNKFYFYRLDYLMYILVRNTYINHYNYLNIKNIINNYPYIGDVNKFIEMVKSVQNYDDNELYSESAFNFDQSKETVIFNIHTINDNVIFNKINNMYLEKNKDNNLKIINYNKNTIGHCSDMAFSEEYLKCLLCSILY